MEGKEAIINKILEDAEKKVAALSSDAESKAETSKQDAENWAIEYLSTQKAILKKDAEDIVSRRLTVADLDIRKLNLSYKQEVISKVLDGVYEKLCKLNKKDYLSFVDSLLENFAEENDEVLLSNDKVLSVEDVKGLKTVKSKNLKVEKYGDFKGGVMLIGKTCDKDLSFKSVIEERKDEFSQIIFQDLFN